jgi:hypothetical protein
MAPEVAEAIFLTRSAMTTWILFAWRAKIFVAVLAAIAAGAMTLVLIDTADTLAVHAGKVCTVIHRLTHQHIMIGVVALARREWARAKQNALN